VKQHWGQAERESRTYYAMADVALSASGGNYNTMDIPLSVDLPGNREFPRCYFIPDGRHDPYGKVKIAESAAHAKTLHLTPFFVAAQRKCDAAAVVVYRGGKDLVRGSGSIESHFVMPREVDGFWVGDRKVDVGRKVSVAVGAREAVVLRKGTAAVGIRVPWAKKIDGSEAPVAFVYDGNEYGVVRLTVDHGNYAGEPPARTDAAAALWVRVGSGLKDDAAFQAWRKEFAAAGAEGAADGKQVRIKVNGVDGPVEVAAASPFADVTALSPPASPAVLEIDGADVGRDILRRTDVIREYLAGRTKYPPIKVGVRGIYWEAEEGWVVPPMKVDADAAASKGKYVWMPGEPGGKGGSVGGSVSWRLEMEKAGAYFAWGRVLSPTPSDDSFFARVEAKGKVIRDGTWALGVHRDWAWVPLGVGEAAAKVPAEIDLPAGEVTFELRTREDGTKIDRLFITGEAGERPVDSQ
jgi:hypothetical protein